jgi:hypothetical protein
MGSPGSGATDWDETHGAPGGQTAISSALAAPTAGSGRRRDGCGAHRYIPWNGTGIAAVDSERSDLPTHKQDLSSSSRKRLHAP